MAATGASVRGRVPSLAKYEIQEEIGHGGMATVYRARDPRLGRDVAIKVIHPHLRDSLEAKHRFYVEAQAVAKLRHENIVEVYDVSAEGEPEQYLVVELVRGLTLRALLEQRGSLPPEIAAALGVELLAALGHAHEAGVVHRDIKPENVMIEHRSGERVRVKLTDFGIAKLLDAQGVTSTGQVLGSPAHMAPEQIEGGDVDGRADIFGLGVLLYECMVGHLPFEGNNPAQVLRRVLEGIYPSAEREQPRVGKRWSMALDRALARTPAERFDGAPAMQRALLDELQVMGVTAPRAELEAWLDAAPADAEARDARTIARLCELGREARKRGAALDAAAHFNRALAYAPHDPVLLKIVSTIQRQRAWRGVLARLIPVILVSAALGTTAFYITRAVRHRGGALTSVGAPGAGSARSPATASSPDEAPTSPPPASAPRPRVPVPAGPQRAPRPVERKITLASVRPPFGVLIALDGKPLGEAREGGTFTLDGKPHEVRFTCAKDECEPQTKVVAPGDEAEVSLNVALSIKPATVVIDGDPALSYGFEEFPSIAVRVGVPVGVPVPHGNYYVHVVERLSGHRQTLRLNPGKEAHFTFTGAADEPGTSSPPP